MALGVRPSRLMGPGAPSRVWTHTFFWGVPDQKKEMYLGYAGWNKKQMKDPP